MFIYKHVKKKLKKSCQIFLLIVQKQKFMDNISENSAQKNVLGFEFRLCNLKKKSTGA